MDKKEINTIKNMSFAYISVLMIGAIKLIYNVLSQGFDKRSKVIKRLNSYVSTFFYAVGGKVYRKEVMLHTLQKAHILANWALSGNDLSVIPWEVWPKEQEKLWDTDPKTGFSTPAKEDHDSRRSAKDKREAKAVQRFLDLRQKDDLKQQKKIRRKLLRPALSPKCFSDLPKNQYLIDIYDANEWDTNDMTIG